MKKRQIFKTISCSIIMMTVLCFPTDCLSDNSSIFLQKNNIEQNILTSVSQVETACADSGALSVYTPSQREIANYYASIKLAGIYTQTEYTYEDEPNLSAPYIPEGLLSGDNLSDALNVVKFVRYIAGVSDNVYLSERYSAFAQQAALISYANGKISHTPQLPSDMNPGLASQAADSCAECNLAKYYAPNVSMKHIIIDGWMDDSDKSNISTLGHRRWILNPNLSTTGFGVISDSDSTYAAMYVLGTGNFDSSQTLVSWPASNMPASMFKGDSAWSLSVGQQIDASKVAITLVKKNTRESWTFNSKGSDGDFYVNNGNYGLEGCIIFRPEGVTSYAPGDSYYVSISGVTDEEISYTVNFFDLEGYFSLSSPEISKISLNSENKPSLSWSKVTGAEKYSIYRKAGNGNWELLKYGLTSTSFDDANAEPGVKYSYAITSLNIVSNTAFESVMSSPRSVSTSLSKVSFTSLSAVKVKKNQLKWKSVKGATGYKIYRRLYGSSTWTLIKTTSSLSYTNTSAKSGKTYQYRIRAYRTTNGNTVYGSYSTTKKVKTK